MLIIFTHLHVATAQSAYKVPRVQNDLRQKMMLKEKTESGWLN